MTQKTKRIIVTDKIKAEQKLAEEKWTVHLGTVTHPIRPDSCQETEQKRRTRSATKVIDVDAEKCEDDDDVIVVSEVIPKKTSQKSSGKRNNTKKTNEAEKTPSNKRIKMTHDSKSINSTTRKSSVNKKGYGEQSNNVFENYHDDYDYTNNYDNFYNYENTLNSSSRLDNIPIPKTPENNNNSQTFTNLPIT